MRATRIYVDETLTIGSELMLPDTAAHHLAHVLRSRVGDSLCLFNGRGGEYSAEIVAIRRSMITVAVQAFTDRESESTLHTHLGLAVIKRAAMDSALIRATELGVSEITPILTEHVSIPARQLRPDHWSQTLQASCEQCGRNRIPILRPVSQIEDWLQDVPKDIGLVAHPAGNALEGMPDTAKQIAILVGPEGGLTDHEVDSALGTGFSTVRLGPRIMRSETAPAAILALVQHKWGDI